MAVLEVIQEENEGLIKELDQESIPILMDIVQKDIYTKGIESSIRETFSNAYDSIKEKLIALSILEGKSSIEDHFTTDSRRETKASIFDLDYYSKEHLSKDKNKVTITYKVAEDEGKDTIIFHDYGVGLGGDRLAGYMRPGYSSKRLSKDMLGKYGVGSKSPLATDIEYYVLETRYNGYYTKFMIYDDYYKCVIPKKGSHQTTIIPGKKEIIGDDGEKSIVEAKEYVYWTETSDFNGITISYNVKNKVKNRNRFIEGVKNQLMYFGEHLEFQVIEEDGEIYTPTFKAEVLHETPLFLVSRNRTYAVPHILINNVNYGVIPWGELEMNKKYGSIAVKAGASDVDVNAPREAVRWTEKTRNFIQAAVEAASEEAGNLLQEELAGIENPIERYLTANRYQSNTGEDKSVLIGQLKSFAGGSVKLNIDVDAKDYLSSDAIKKVGLKATKIPVMRLIHAFDRFKSSTLTIASHRVSIAELRGAGNLDFSNLYYLKHEENSYNIRLDLALFISHDSGKSGIQLLTYKDYKGEPDSIEGFILANAKAKKIDILNKEALIKKSLKDKKILRDYKYHVEAKKRERLAFLVLEALIVQNKQTVDIASIDENSVKEHAKKINLMSNPVIRQTVEDRENGRAGSAYVETKSDKAIQKDNIAALKKEKKLLNYRKLWMDARVRFDVRHYSDVHGFNFNNIATADLPTSKSKVVYASTEDRETLIIAAAIYLMTSDLGSIYSDGIDPNKTNFILISKSNFKFFKLMQDSVHVRDYIKEEHLPEGDKLTLKLGDNVRRFITAIYIQEIMVLSPINRSLGDTNFTEYLREYPELKDSKLLELIQESSKILDKCPMSNDSVDSDSVLTSIQDKFKRILRDDFNMSNELLESLYSLSKIQNTPTELLGDKEKTMVKSFTEIDLQTYDQEFVNELEIYLTKYREVLELVYMDYIVITYDKSVIGNKLHENLKAQIEARLATIN